MAIDVNEDQDGDVIYGADDLERFFPGCVVRKGDEFTMNHERLTARFIMAIKATTELDMGDFLRLMAERWDNCEVDKVEGSRIQ